MASTYTTPNVEALLRQKGIQKLYHFTDRANISSIIDNNGLFSWKACEQKGITSSKPGGSETSRSLDSHRGLGNYVRLSFTREHPMMYVAKKDGRISNPVILEIDLSIVNRTGTLFADRNATKNGVIIRQGYEGAQNIHFQTVTRTDYFNIDPEEKEFYQAEVLVQEMVPISYITNIDKFRPTVQSQSQPQPRPQVTITPSKPSTYVSYLREIKPIIDLSKIETPIDQASSYNKYNSNKQSSSSSDNIGCWVVIGIFVLIFIVAAICG